MAATEQNQESSMVTEPVTQAQVDALIRAVGPVAAMIARLHEVDISRGRSTLGNRRHHMWTKDGHLITVSITVDGGVIVSCSKTLDDEADHED